MKPTGQGFNRVIRDQVGKLDTGSRACTTPLSQEFRALRVTGSESLSGASIPAVISSTAAVANSLAAASEPATTVAAALPTTASLASPTSDSTRDSPTASRW